MKEGLNSDEIVHSDNPILNKTIHFALQIIDFSEKLRKLKQFELASQIIKSGTSVGANVHEAQGAQSKADFIAKMSIAHKEAYETSYWMRIMTEAEVVKQEQLAPLADETNQIVKILSSILITSKNNK